MEPKAVEQIRRAVLYGLSLPLPDGRPATAEDARLWKQLANRLLTDPALRRRFAEEFVEPLVEIVACGAHHRAGEPQVDAQRQHRWRALQLFLARQGELPRVMVSRAAEVFTRAAEKAPPAAEPPSPLSEIEMTTPVGPVWRHLPVPSAPEPHTEYDARELPPVEGFRVVGARVRGKKHKHEGSNCDDWFEFSRAGPWTLIAVSDGAGSKSLSRIGARVSCETAVASLADSLGGHRVEPRPTLDAWQGALSRFEPQLLFAGADIQRVQEAMVAAVEGAYAAVEAAAAGRRQIPEFEAALGRPPEVNDLSATLLLAAHTVVPVGDSDWSLVLACQIGDGITATIPRRGGVRVLGEPDRGGYSGETEFLTSAGKRAAESLARKTFTFFGPLEALLVMTDGVADDYFPPDPELGRLWDDLLSHQLLAIQGSADEAAPAGRLQQWLDSYQVRGSFDDRTLVVLHREVLP